MSGLLEHIVRRRRASASRRLGPQASDAYPYAPESPAAPASNGAGAHAEIASVNGSETSASAPAPQEPVTTIWQPPASADERPAPLPPMRSWMPAPVAPPEPEPVAPPEPEPVAPPEPEPVAPPERELEPVAPPEAEAEPEPEPEAEATPEPQPRAELEPEQEAASQPDRIVWGRRPIPVPEESEPYTPAGAYPPAEPEGYAPAEPEVADPELGWEPAEAAVPLVAPVPPSELPPPVPMPSFGDFDAPPADPPAPPQLPPARTRTVRRLPGRMRDLRRPRSRKADPALDADAPPAAEAEFAAELEAEAEFETEAAAASLAEPPVPFDQNAFGPAPAELPARADVEPEPQTTEMAALRASDLDPALQPQPQPPAPGFGERGRMRRRARYLRALREIQLRDIGGFALELHRFDQRRPELLEAKVRGAAVTDTELRALERALGEGATMRQLREAGIGGACDNCGAVHGSTDRFCATCGESLDISRYERDETTR